MKLHYSQTRKYEGDNNRVVLIPYEITLFSNLANRPAAAPISFNTL